MSRLLRPPAGLRLVRSHRMQYGRPPIYVPTKATALSMPDDVATDTAFDPVAELPFKLRSSFALPNTIPSWYAGHMYRAMRSLPALLSREPPPLIIEARDARLPISSINPAFEELLMSMEAKQKGSGGGNTAAVEDEAQPHELHDFRAWRQRRLVLYNKADLIDARLHAPIRSAFMRHQGGDVMFVNAHDRSDVKRVLSWIHERAATLAKSAKEMGVYAAQAAARETVRSANGAPPSALQPSATMGLMPRSARQRNLVGSFRTTTTPERGIRLVILGMPNVGKSSMLNALRHIGTGAGKAASTAPMPGHTRKLSSTVRITKKIERRIDVPKGRARSAAAKEEKKAALDAYYDMLRSQRDGDDDGEEQPAVYVYDTPGVMVPYLGSGVEGAEKGVKLAAAAGMKSSLFDAVGLVDYLLYRMNLQWAWRWQKWHKEQSVEPEPLPAYLTGLPMGRVHGARGSDDARSFGPTDDVEALLERLSLRAPGTLGPKGTRDLTQTANFMLDRWRTGKLGSGELDTGCFEMSAEHDQWTEAGLDARIEAVVARHFERTRVARNEGAATSFKPVRGADLASRRKLEKTDWRELRERQKQEQTKDKASDATPSSSLLSKRQTKAREHALDVAIRNNRLRERGIPINGLLAANQAKYREFRLSQIRRRQRR